ncbi:hypothetical protein MAR_020004, partial [Mya arenaria]
ELRSYTLYGSLVPHLLLQLSYVTLYCTLSCNITRTRRMKTSADTVIFSNLMSISFDIEASCGATPCTAVWSPTLSGSGLMSPPIVHSVNVILTPCPDCNIRLKRRMHFPADIRTFFSPTYFCGKCDPS